MRDIKRSPKFVRFVLRFPAGLWLLVIAVVGFVIFAWTMHSMKNDSNVANLIVDFIQSWGTVIAAFATLLLAIAAFVTIRETRKTRNIEAIRNWANSANWLLMSSRTSKQGMQIILPYIRNEIASITSSAINLGVHEELIAVLKAIDELGDAITDRYSGESDFTELFIKVSGALNVLVFAVE